MLRTKLEGIVIHHSAIRSSDNDDGYTLYDMSTSAEHLRHRGIYSRAEYGYIVAKNGKIIECVPEMEVTGHCGNDSYNEKYVGISCDGYYDGTDAQTMPKSQMDALVKLVTGLVKKHNIPLGNIIPHRQVMSTACPGDKFPWSKFIQRLIREIGYHMIFKIGSTAVEVCYRKGTKGVIVYLPSAPFLSSNLVWLPYRAFAFLGYHDLPATLTNNNGNVTLRDFAKYSGRTYLEWDPRRKIATVTQLMTALDRRLTEPRVRRSK